MQRYFTNLVKNNCFILNNDDMYHIKTVMRMKEKDLIEVVYDNKLFLGKLDDNFNIFMDKEIDSSNVRKKEYTLCLPLLTDQKMSMVLQKATELGVDKIIPVITVRSVVKMDDKREMKKLERWQTICKEASEQSKRMNIPIVTNITKLSDLKMDGLKILCSTVEKKNTLKKVISDSFDKITFIVGPEGGFDPREEELLIKLGFVSTTLGNNIFRVETAPIYVLSILKYEE